MRPVSRYPVGLDCDTNLWQYKPFTRIPEGRILSLIRHDTDPEDEEPLERGMDGQYNDNMPRSSSRGVLRGVSDICGLSTGHSLAPGGVPLV
jgi:hypothetical protein